MKTLQVKTMDVRTQLWVKGSYPTQAKLQITNLTHTICDLKHHVIPFSTRRWRQIQHGMQIHNKLEY